MQCHDVDYTIIGDDMQMVQVELDPGETVIAEAGAMNYMEPDIEFEARMGDGSEAESGFMGKLFGAGKRALTGESIFMTHFSNQWMLQETFHPEVVAITPFLFAYLAAERGRWVLYGTLMAVAVSWKEDVALAAIMMGVILLVRGHRGATPTERGQLVHEALEQGAVGKAGQVHRMSRCVSVFCRAARRSLTQDRLIHRQYHISQ